MKHSVLITSLKGRKGNEEISYYFYNDGAKNVYCDALTSAEAGCKYILANYDIDMILTFGSDSSYDPGDDLRSMPLNEGKSLYRSDMQDMSSYGLFRYRLAEYLDEINAEVQDCRELLDEAQQKDAEAFIRGYFKKYNDNSTGSGRNARFDRFFDVLARNEELCAEMEQELYEAARKKGSDPQNWLKWIRYYLYEKYREHGKMYLLEKNENTKVKFISSGKNNDDGTAFAELLIENLIQIHKIAEEDDGEVEIYLSLQDDSSKDAFVLTSLIETIRDLPGRPVNIAKILMTETPLAGGTARIFDDTGKLAVSDLLAGARTFLRYGKTDLLLDFLDKEKHSNPDIGRMLYAMRNIDIGISLCDIADIERGINSLKSFFADVKRIEGDSFAEMYFNVIAGGIKEDYGPLLSSNKIEFIDLVKWAYRKGFWQQTLTIIESRAPQEFVEKGIFYYCDASDSRQEIIKKFGRLYFDLKVFEKYKMDDVAHYFIKCCSRWKSSGLKNGKEYQLEYTRIRIRELESDDSNIIKAHTLCPDVKILTELMFAYYYLGNVRNATNHAADEFSGFISTMNDSDVSERMNLINQTIGYFIHCYENVVNRIDKSARSRVVQIRTSEIVDYSNNTLRKAARAERRGKTDK